MSSSNSALFSDSSHVRAKPSQLLKSMYSNAFLQRRNAHRFDAASDEWRHCYSKLRGEQARERILFSPLSLTCSTSNRHRRGDIYVVVAATDEPSIPATGIGDGDNDIDDDNDVGQLQPWSS